MALDSSGNIAVDFAWGNVPLQPDTERGALPVVQSWANGYTSVNGYGAILTGFAPEDVPLVTPGKEVVVKDYLGTTLLTGTVKELSLAATDTFLVLTDLYDPTRPTSFGADASLTVSTPLNFGGGEGDYGWSSTTKVKSLELDPALDGHNIATEFWNNFPGYTPNAGFIPQETWSGTFLGGSLAISVEAENPADSLAVLSYGYRVSIYGGGLSAEEHLALNAVIDSEEIIGKTVSPISMEFTGMGSTVVNWPEGHVVSANAFIDSYGNPVSQFTVYTPEGYNLTSYSGGVIADGTSVVIGAGANKSVIYRGVTGEDFQNLILTVNDSHGDGITDLRFYTDGGNVSADTIALAGNITNALVGFYVGDSMTAYNFVLNREAFVATTAETLVDAAYGATSVKLNGVENYTGDTSYYNSSINPGTIVWIIQ